MLHKFIRFIYFFERMVRAVQLTLFPLSASLVNETPIGVMGAAFRTLGCVRNKKAKSFSISDLFE